MLAIGLMRGVNVGGTGKLPMAAWRALCERIGLEQVRTYIQSGNVVFVTREKDLAAIATQMEAAIEKEFGFRRPALLLSLEDLRGVVKRNPFPAGRDPAKLIVSFLAGAIGDETRAKVAELAQGHPEELICHERELFVYFPNGQGRTKLPLAKIEKALGVACTARNWNTVLKLVEMAEASGG